MNGPVITRRALVAGAVGAVALVGVGGASAATASDEARFVRPPGGQDVAHLRALCIRCDRCREACPTGVIESAPIEAGLADVRTPVLGFRHASGSAAGVSLTSGYCDFCDPGQEGGREKRCVASCPTGALLAFDERAGRIGVAKIDPVYCINYPQLGQSPTGCRVCVDACPYGAISLSAEARPQVDASVCNGCGKCEAVCPSASYRQLIGVNTLEERAAAGEGTYAESLAYYRMTGRIPRGINVTAGEGA